MDNDLIGNRSNVRWSNWKMIQLGKSSSDARCHKTELRKCYTTAPESKQQHEELIRLEELRKEEESLQKRNHQLRTRVELMEKRIRRFKWKVKETVTSMNEMAVKMGIDVEQRW